MLSELFSGLHYAILMLYSSLHYSQFYGTVPALQEICFYFCFHILRTKELSLSSSTTVSYQLWPFPLIYQLLVPIPVSINMSDVVYSITKQNTITISQLMDPMEPGCVIIIAFLVFDKLPSTQRPNNHTTRPIPVNIYCPTTVIIIIFTVGNMIKILCYCHLKNIWLHQPNIVPGARKTINQ